ncbi:hypothetical protein PUN28_003237 [Cardiocondyla obscurior]|uniref:Uncharacterized protein n=1 Tax=Cardiocondyla obscurior TaxID=286306 RepID=A0AAW2GLA5_9HYME
MGEEGGIGFPHAIHPHATALTTRLSHPLLSACHPACPPTRHPAAVEETTCNRTSITFPRTTIFVERLALSPRCRSLAVRKDLVTDSDAGR